MNPYKILEVAPDASQDDIKKRYRKLARETHPDLNPGDAAAEARFKDISVAYDVLSDPEKRAAFDQFGEIALEAGTCVRPEIPRRACSVGNRQLNRLRILLSVLSEMGVWPLRKVYALSAV